MTDYYGYSTIATSLDDGILRVTLNRPDRLNALDRPMHKELRTLFERIAHDADVKVVVVTGAGRAFCVGADFQQMRDNLAAADYPDGRPDMLADGADIARGILRVRQPMVAMVNGHALGIGATLALFCDVVYMSSAAKIGDPHVQAGIVAGDGGCVLWPMLLGINRAKEYLMTGDLLSAEDADRMGLVNHVVAPEALEDAGMAMARRLAAGPTHAIQFNKRVVNKMLEDQVSRLYDLSLALECVTFETADHHEAVEAFLEKREPTFG
ncbi:MAG: enoyl-CoA hydratase-related protein [Acidimicrobiia bacterium]